MAEERKLPLISSAFLNVTQKCNLKCKYCFVCQQPKEITYEVAQDAAKFLARNALESGTTPSINFFGGEPMLRYKDIIKPLTEWIRDVYGYRFELSLTTNGTLLTEEIMKFFDKNNIGMLFSIDGDKKTQDINRPYHSGKGSFDRLEPIIDLVLKYYPNMIFRATIDPPTHKELFNNYKFAIRKGYTNCFFIPNVFSEWSDKELEELDIELDKICDYYIAELKAERKPMSFSHFDRARADIKRIAKLKDGDYREDGKCLPACGRCGLGANRFAAIGVTGNIYSCQEMVENPEVGDKFMIGNIYSGVDDARRYALVNSFDALNAVCSKKEYCDDCIKRRICDGGCSINNFFKNKDLHVQDYVMCWYERKCIEKMYRIMKMEKKGVLKWH